MAFKIPIEKLGFILMALPLCLLCIFSKLFLPNTLYFVCISSVLAVGCGDFIYGPVYLVLGGYLKHAWEQLFLYLRHFNLRLLNFMST